MTAASFFPHINPGELKWTQSQTRLNSFLKFPLALLPSTSDWWRFSGSFPLLRFSSTGEPVSRASWTKPWEREELLGRNVSHCRLDNRVREEGRVHEREKRPQSIKGAENNTLLTAEIRGFLESVYVKEKWIFVCHSLVSVPLVSLYFSWDINYDNKAVNHFFSTPDYGGNEIAEHKFSISQVDPEGLNIPPVILVSSASGKHLLRHLLWQGCFCFCLIYWEKIWITEGCELCGFLENDRESKKIKSVKTQLICFQAAWHCPSE